MIFKKIQIVKFQHCDFAGIVFFPRFLDMCNELVEDWFKEALDYSFKKMHQKEFGVPTVKLNIDFLAPAKLYDNIEKQLQVTDIGSSSIKLEINFMNVHTKKTVLTGETVLVHVKKLKSCKWEEKMKNKMKTFLNT